MYKRRNFWDWLSDNIHIIVLSIIIVIVISTFIGSIVFSINDHTYTITITDKERVNKDNDSYYLIFGETEDGDIIVLSNEDCFWRGKFNSSNVYGELKVGETYKFTVVGYRVPFFSWYENIIDYEKID